jgi:hypothetical protein
MTSAPQFVTKRVHTQLHGAAQVQTQIDMANEITKGKELAVQA